MTPDERNQTIHEARGLCWHEKVDNIEMSNGEFYNADICSKCKSSTPFNPDYSKWEHYGPLLENWAIKETWYVDFILKTFFDDDGHGRIYTITAIVPLNYMLNPLKGSIAIAKFLKERKING